MEFHKAKTILTKPPAPSFNSHFFLKKTYVTDVFFFSSKIGFHERTATGERLAGGMRTFSIFFFCGSRSCSCELTPNAARVFGARANKPCKIWERWDTVFCFCLCFF